MNKYIFFNAIILIIFIVIIILFYNNNKETFYNVILSSQDIDKNIFQLSQEIDEIDNKLNILNMDKKCNIIPECNNKGQLSYISRTTKQDLIKECTEYANKHKSIHECVYKCAGGFKGCDYNTGKASYVINRIYYTPYFIDDKYKPTYCSFTEADMISHYQYEARYTTNKDAKETISSKSLDHYNKNSNNIQQNIEINCPVDCIVAYNKCDYNIGKQSVRYMASPINGGNPCPNTEPKNCNDCEGEWSECDANNMQTYTITKTKQGENTRDCLFKDKEQRVCTDIPDEPIEEVTIGKAK